MKRQTSDSTVSFEAKGIVLSESVSPPDDPAATPIGQYFDAVIGEFEDTGFLNASLHDTENDVSSVEADTLSL